jgi:hypothetical protein
MLIVLTFGASVVAERVSARGARRRTCASPPRPWERAPPDGAGGKPAPPGRGTLSLNWGNIGSEGLPVDIGYRRSLEGSENTYTRGVGARARWKTKRIREDVG